MAPSCGALIASLFKNPRPRKRDDHKTLSRSGYAQKNEDLGVVSAHEVMPSVILPNSDHDKSNLQANLGPGTANTACPSTTASSRNVHADRGDVPQRIITDRPPTTPDIIRKGILPMAVPCRLIIFMNTKQYEHFELFQLRWQDNSQHGFLDEITKAFLTEKLPADKEFYHKAGRIRLLQKTEDGRETEIDSQKVESIHEWSEKLPVMVGQQFSSNIVAKYFLEIRWEYGVLPGLPLPCITGRKYATVVRDALMNARSYNYKSEWYVPRRVIEHIFSRKAIIRLVDEDEKLSRFWLEGHRNKRGLTREDFIEKVFLNGTRLLATCIYAQLDMKSLYTMIRNEMQDSSIPLREDQIPKDADVGHADHFYKSQGGFKPHDFVDINPSRSDASVVSGQRHWVVPTGIVVPVMFDEKTDLIDKGSFGKVFRARIHGDHHNFSPNKDTLFALKQFIHGDLSSDDFEKESAVLETLATVPHSNITPYLASWTQDDRFFMLFPLAEGNLRSFLRKEPAPELNGEFVTWLLGQLEGVAAALDHIHNLGPANLSLAQPLQTDKNQIRTGYHHDLKPENILVFANGILKISDFGTAKIVHVVSGNGKGISHQTPNLTFGDADYGGPDYKIQNTTSRPYDIWSLGCIFVEILLWTFGRGGPALDTFYEKRRISPQNQENQQIASFWYELRDGDKKTWHLKKEVKDELTELKYATQHRGVFRDLLILTRRMLHHRPESRPRAPDVRSQINGLLQQAKLDLKNPDFYKKDDFQSQSTYGLPSTAGVSNEETCSIDGRMQSATPARPTRHLTPESIHLRQRRSSSSSINVRPDMKPINTAVNKDLLLQSGAVIDSPDSNGSSNTPRPRLRQPSISIDGKILLRSPDTTPQVGADECVVTPFIDSMRNPSRREDFLFRSHTRSSSNASGRSLTV